MDLLLLAEKSNCLDWPVEQEGKSQDSKKKHDTTRRKIRAHPDTRIPILESTHPPTQHQTLVTTETCRGATVASATVAVTGRWSGRGPWGSYTQEHSENGTGHWNQLGVSYPRVPAGCGPPSSPPPNKKLGSASEQETLLRFTFRHWTGFPSTAHKKNLSLLTPCLISWHTQSPDNSVFLSTDIVRTLLCGFGHCMFRVRHQACKSQIQSVHKLHQQ